MSTHDILMAASGGGDNDLVLTVTFTSTTIFRFVTSGINGAVSWGDGGANTVIPGWTIGPVTGQIASQRTYTAGTYTIRVNGAKLTPFTYFYIDTGGNGVTGVSNFGNFFSRFQFFNCTNLASLPAILPPTVTSMDSMLYGCTNQNLAVISGWDTSNVTNMAYTFWGNQAFNRPLNSWNVSNVTTMQNMFSTCYAFNQPLGLWNTANVTTFSTMFYFCFLFNQDLSTWNTGSATDMSSMFLGCNAFNQPLNSWNVSNVTTMASMLSQTSFNYPLNSWNVSNVTQFSGFVSNSPTFNQSLNSWNVSAATDMSNMFGGCSAYNQSMSTWNTSNVTNMSLMFRGCTVFNQSISNFNTANVTNMQWMFLDASSFNQSLSNFNTAKVTDMSLMFQRASSFNQPLTTFNTVNVTNMTQMFLFASSFNQDLSGWCVGNITSYPSNFDSGTITLPPIWGTCPAYSAASSITRIGSATGVNSATLPAHVAGDLIIAFVFRRNSTVLPTLPAGWTSLTTQTGFSNSARLAYKIAASSSETSGTWTSATASIFLVYRGVNTTDITRYAATNFGNVSAVNYRENNAWINLAWTLAFAGSSNGTLALETAPTGATTLVANYVDASNESASFDSNGPSAGFSTANVVLASASNWITITHRLRVPITL